MKKSSTTMNVPARTTGRGAQRPVRAPKRRVGETAGEVICCVLMASTIPARRVHVDYLTGNTLTSRVMAGEKALSSAELLDHLVGPVEQGLLDVVRNAGDLRAAVDLALRLAQLLERTVEEAERDHHIRVGHVAYVVDRMPARDLLRCSVAGVPGGAKCLIGPRLQAPGGQGADHR